MQKCEIVNRNARFIEPYYKEFLPDGKLFFVYKTRFFCVINNKKGKRGKEKE